MRRTSNSLLKALAYLMGAIILLLAGIEFTTTRSDEEGVRAVPIQGDRRRIDLGHCRALAPEQLDTDSICQDAWAENRRRFFGTPAGAPEA